MGARRAVPAAKASGRYRFGEGTFPRIPGNDGEAPIADVGDSAARGRVGGEKLASRGEFKLVQISSL